MSSTARKHSASAVSEDAPNFSILLATAGDPTSLGAVRAAVQLARRLHAKVNVLAIATPFLHATRAIALGPSPALIDENSRGTVLDAAREQLRLVRGTAGWPIHAATGWAADVIVATARRSNAMLIVVGIGEHSLMSRLFGSETAVDVAKRAGTPILAVPADFSARPRRAFAAIDFSPSSVTGACLAASLIAPRGTVTLVHTSVFAKATLEEGSFMGIYAAGATDRLATIAKQIKRDTHRQVDSMLVEGTVADALVSIAEKEHGDLIALGSHDRGLVDRLLLGSVRTKVLRHAPCTVLIVPELNEAPH